MKGNVLCQTSWWCPGQRAGGRQGQAGLPQIPRTAEPPRPRGRRTQWGSRPVPLRRHGDRRLGEAWSCLRWLALLPTYRPLGCTEEKEAGDYNKSTERTDWEEPASPSSAWPVDPLGGRGMRGGGRAPAVERFELPPRMAIYSSIPVPDEHPSRERAMDSGCDQFGVSSWKWARARGGRRLWTEPLTPSVLLMPLASPQLPEDFRGGDGEGQTAGSTCWARTRCRVRGQHSGGLKSTP